jgi:hypothetical protein
MMLGWDCMIATKFSKCHQYLVWAMAWGHVTGPTVSTLSCSMCMATDMAVQSLQRVDGDDNVAPARMKQVTGMKLQIGLHVCKFNVGPDIGIRVGLTS